MEGTEIEKGSLLRGLEYVWVGSGQEGGAASGICAVDGEASDVIGEGVPDN